MSASGSGPGDIASRGPFSFLAGDYSDIIALFEEFSDTLDAPDLNEVSEDILDLPPEERFIESIEIFKTIYGLEKSEPLKSHGPADLDEDVREFFDQFPVDILFSNVMQFLKQKVQESHRKALDRLVTDRSESEGYLIASVFLSRLYESFEVMEEGYYQDKDSIAQASPMITLFSRLYLIAAGEQTEFTEDFLRDLIRAKYHLSRMSGEEPEYNPEELTREEIIPSIRREGAIVAYENQEISVGRGAELAGVSTSQFEEILIRNGIVPRYGPEEGTELLEGPGLSKSDW